MPRVDATVPPDAIRIEDEVWQEAFARREPVRSRTRRRLQAIDGGSTTPTLESHATAVDETAEPIEVPEWVGMASVDSNPSSRAGSLGDTPAAADSLDDPSGADTLTVAAPRPVASPPGSAVRRTVTIRGRGAEAHLPWPDASRGRPQRRAYERAGFRPDRLAMWAVLLGFLLVLVAILSPH